MGEVQVNNLGEVITEDAREYVYVPELTESRIKPPEVVLPFKKEALNGVFSSLKDTIHHNYMGGPVAVGKNYITILWTLSNLNQKPIVFTHLGPETCCFYTSGSSCLKGW